MPVVDTVVCVQCLKRSQERGERCRLWLRWLRDAMWWPRQSDAAALFTAVEHGDVEIVDRLIAARCNVDQPDQVRALDHASTPG